MKKIIVTAIGACVFLAAVTAVYRFAFRKSVPDAQPSEQVAAILEQNGCYACHTGEEGKPFYANLPLAGAMLDAHIDHGSKFLNLKRIDLEHPSEVLLAMLDYTLQHDNMPLMEYKMAHWGTGFNKQEKSVLAKWILDTRARLYPNTGVAAEFTGEPLRLITEMEHDEAKAALGEKMYNDTRISLDGTISCATCHVLGEGGADPRGTRTSEGIGGNFGGINAPTVYNAGFNVEQFWNGRAHTLADQAGGPPVNPMEMGDQTWDQIVERLRQDASLVAEFKKLYPEQGLTMATVTDAIEHFERRLTTPNDKLDQYLRGNKNALTATELAGYQAFKDNSCATCHVGKTLGGQSFEYMGIFEDYFAARQQSHPDVAMNDDDKGLNGFTGKAEDLYRFKVPNLRNISRTAPYYHDGTQATIEDAVRGMFRFELGKTATDEQVASISAFLRALDGQNDYLKTAQKGK